MRAQIIGWILTAFVAGAAAQLVVGDTGVPKRRLGEMTSVSAMAYSGDGKLLVTATVGEIQLWDAGTYTLRRALSFDRYASSHSRDTYSLAVNRTGDEIAASTYAGTFLWNAVTGEKRQLTTDQDRARFVDGGKVLLTVAYSGECRWSVPEGKLLEAIPDREEPRRRLLALSPDGSLAVRVGPFSSVDSRRVDLDRVATGEVVRQLAPPESELVTTSAEFSPDGKLLVTGDCSNRYTTMTAVAHAWDVPAGRLVATMGGHTGRQLDARFSADGRTLVTAGWDAIRVWDPRTGKLLRTLDESRDCTTLLAVAPDGKSAVAQLRRAAGSPGPALALWDLRTGRRLPL